MSSRKHWHQMQTFPAEAGLVITLRLMKLAQWWDFAYRP
jgi:hypothetical protein